MPVPGQDFTQHIDVCAAIPHPFISVMVFWCPHLQRFGGWVDIGSSTHIIDDIAVHEIQAGPFDSTQDVVESLQLFLSASALDEMKRSV